MVYIYPNLDGYIRFYGTYKQVSGNRRTTTQQRANTTKTNIRNDKYL